MFNISFNFDPETSKVLDVKISKVDLSEPVLLVEDNKLRLSENMMKVLDVSFGENIVIKYWNVSNEETFPVIGKNDAFEEDESGNKITKLRTVSFRGKQRDTLLIYGSKFTVEKFKEGIFKLVPVSENNATNETPSANGEE